MLSYILFIILSTTIAFSSKGVDAGNAELDNWKLVKEKNEIKVFVNRKSKGYEAVRVEATIYTDLKTFVDYINEAKYYTDWLYLCTEAKEISNQENIFIYYTITKMPFPFYDRILTAKSIQEYSKKVFVSNSVAIPPLEENSDLVAIPYFKSQWVITETSPSILSIYYQVIMDPGGNIPPWLSNMAVDIGPYNTMNNLKQITESL